jgi:hypothetical protein
MSRSEENIAAALNKLRCEGTGKGEVISLKLDLGDPRQAKAAAEQFLTPENRLDVQTHYIIFSPSIPGLH